MFDNLKKRLQDVFSSIGKKPSIEEKDLDIILRELQFEEKSQIKISNILPTFSCLSPCKSIVPI